MALAAGAGMLHEAGGVEVWLALAVVAHNAASGSCTETTTCAAVVAVPTSSDCPRPRYEEHLHGYSEPERRRVPATKHDAAPGGTHVGGQHHDEEQNESRRSPESESRNQQTHRACNFRQAGDEHQQLRTRQPRWHHRDEIPPHRCEVRHRGEEKHRRERDTRAVLPCREESDSRESEDSKD